MSVNSGVSRVKVTLTYHCLQSIAGVTVRLRGSVRGSAAEPPVGSRGRAGHG